MGGVGWVEWVGWGGWSGWSGWFVVCMYAIRSLLGCIFCNFTGLCTVSSLLSVLPSLPSPLLLTPLPFPPHSQVKEAEKVVVDYVSEARQRLLDEKVLTQISDTLNSCQVEILPGRVFPYLCFYDNWTFTYVQSTQCDCSVWHVTKGSCRSYKMADCPPQHATMSGSHLPVSVN